MKTTLLRISDTLRIFLLEIRPELGKIAVETSVSLPREVHESKSLRAAATSEWSRRFNSAVRKGRFSGAGKLMLATILERAQALPPRFLRSGACAHHCVWTSAEYVRCSLILRRLDRSRITQIE